MGLTVHLRWLRATLCLDTGRSRRLVAGRTISRAIGWALLGLSALGAPLAVAAQLGLDAQVEAIAGSNRTISNQRFVGGRRLVRGGSAARAMQAARREHAAMVKQLAVLPRTTSLTANWQQLGPVQVASSAYGAVTGRISSVAIDAADTTGNTVYVGTSGGGVWKSTNAAGLVGSVRFVPLTDTLPVFSANAGTVAMPSLSIGALSVGSGVVLAGTGDPNDAADSYYGSGLLRSVDGGLSWTLIEESHDGVAGNHSFVGLGFAGFAWSSAASNVVVAAVSQSAEGTLVNAVDATNSVMGLYYSTDAGVSWQMAVLMDGSQTVQTPLPSGSNVGGNAATAVVWNPVRQRFYAAIRYHGYYESADGATWTRMSVQPGAGLTASACPTNPGSTGSLGCPMFRGALAVQAGTGDTFALTVDLNNVDQGLWQDVCSLGGNGCGGVDGFEKQIVTSALEVGSGSRVIAQADYNLALTAVQTGAGGSLDTLLYVGTEDVYRCSLAAGCLFRNTTNSVNGCGAPAKVAPADHVVAALAMPTNPLVFVGNDGGLWRSLDGINEQGVTCSPNDATHFDNLNGGLGSLAEVVSLAQDPTSSEILLVGLGANGSAGTATASSLAAWTQLAMGEGGTVAIDAKNPQLWYVSTAAGVSIRQCVLGANCTAADFAGAPTLGAAQVADDMSLIDAPWLLDPALTSQVVLGTCRVWRGPGSSGALWSGSNVISPMLGGTQGAACIGVNPLVRSLAAGGVGSSVQNLGSPVIYAGMAGVLDGGGALGGHVFGTAAAETSNGSTAWNDFALSLVTNDFADQGKFNPGGFDVSSVTVDEHDVTGRTVYVTVMGFTGNGINAPHVYRTVDGGATWTNISSNLPNAPANSLVVDPNDANTLYVALDTGVYVTTQVTTCTTSNCWSVYGVGLPNAPVMQLVAAAGMATGDGRAGELRAATYGRGVWELPLLTAYSPAQPVMQLQPVVLTFSTQAVGTQSAVQTITVTNSGTAPLVVSQVTATGDFHATETCTGSAVMAGSTCSVAVSFLPSAVGKHSGVLTVYGNVVGGQATVPLSGDAVAGAAVLLQPVELTFAATTLHAVSAAQNITISNTGGVAVGLQTFAVTGDFSLSANTCGPSLGASVGCTVAVVFQPTASGTRSGSLTVTDDLGTQTAVLTGTGSTPATDALTPASLTFGSQQLNTASAMQTVTLSNAGDVALTLIAAQITAGDFAVVNACGNSLNAHASCSIGVVFQPKSVGAGSGVLSVSDEYRTQTVGLSGTGVAPPGVSVSPVGGLVFAATAVGSSASAQVVTLTNNGGVALSMNGMSVSGDFAMVAGGNGCGVTLAVGAACTVQIAFTPTAGGPRSGALTVNDSALNSPQMVSLAGVGVDFALTADGSTTQTISSGGSAVFPLLLSSGAAIPGTAVLQCMGAPVNTTCLVTPSSVVLGSTSTVSVTVDTGVTSAALQPVGGGLRRASWWAWLLPLGLLGWHGRLRGVRLASLLLLCGLLGAAGCGAGRTIPGGGTTPVVPVAVTPAGTYGLVVTASSAGLVRSMNLSLVVQ